MSLRGICFFLQCYLVLAAAMYFDLEEREEKCIIEEIPVDTLVTGESCRGKYSSWVSFTSSPAVMKVELDSYNCIRNSHVIFESHSNIRTFSFYSK